MSESGESPKVSPEKQSSTISSSESSQHRGFLKNLLERFKGGKESITDRLDHRLESWHDFVNGQLIRLEGLGEPKGILQQLKDNLTNPNESFQDQLRFAQQTILEPYLDTAHKLIITLRMKLGGGKESLEDLPKTPLKR